MHDDVLFLSHDILDLYTLYCTVLYLSLNINFVVSLTMENCSNCSANDPNLAGPGFGAFLILVLLVVIIAIVLNVTIITALCVAHSVSKLMRIFLINLLVAGVIVALIGIGFILFGLVLNFTSLPPPDLGFCRFLVWGYSAGSIARLYCLAGFAIVVLLIVRYNKKEMKTLHIVIFLVLIWCVSILLNNEILIPPIYAVQYFDNVACFPRTLDADIIIEARYVFTATWVIFGGLTPLTICIVVPIVVLCYVRRNTIAEGSSYNKGIARFTLFLVAGNLMNIIGQAVVALIVYVSEPPGVYLSYLAGLISLIPTPIMILIFMKPVRAQVTKVICRARIPSIPHVSKVSSTTDRTGSTAVENNIQIHVA